MAGVLIVYIFVVDYVASTLQGRLEYGRRDPSTVAKLDRTS